VAARPVPTQMRPTTTQPLFRPDWRHAVLAVAPALLVVLATTPVSAQDSAAAVPAERKVSGGVYSAAQASRGENVFKVTCISCHAESDYQGEQFQLDWVTKTAFDLFDSIRTLMPDDDPGILAREEYLDVTAYIFSLNRYPTGESDLPGDDDGLKLIRIDAPPGTGLALGTGTRKVSPHPVVRRAR